MPLDLLTIILIALIPVTFVLAFLYYRRGGNGGAALAVAGFSLFVPVVPAIFALNFYLKARKAEFCCTL